MQGESVSAHLQCTSEHRLLSGVPQELLRNLRPHIRAVPMARPGQATLSTGVHACVEGEFSHVPLHGVSKRQACVSSSTPQAELAIGHYAYHKVLLPAMDLWGVLLPTAGKGIFHEDNTAMIQVIRTGRSPDHETFASSSPRLCGDLA